MKFLTLRHLVLFCLLFLFMTQNGCTVDLVIDAGQAFLNHDWDRAITIYTKLIRRDSKNGVYYACRAEAFYSKGSYDSAISDYTQAINLLNKQKKQKSKFRAMLIEVLATSYSGRGICWCKKGYYTRATSDFKTAHAISPRTRGAFKVYFDRAECYREKGEYDRALADYEWALRFQPGQAGAIHGYEATLKLQMQEARALVDATSGPQGSALSDASQFHTTPRPGIQIHSMEVKPDRMPLKASFDLVFEFSVTELSLKKEQIPVTFNYTILEGKQVLFTSKPKVLLTFNGKTTQRVVHLTATDQRGTYEIQVYLEYKNNNREMTLKKASMEFVID